MCAAARSPADVSPRQSHLHHAASHTPRSAGAEEAHEAQPAAKRLKLQSGMAQQSALFAGHIPGGTRDRPAQTRRQPEQRGTPAKAPHTAARDASCWAAGWEEVQAAGGQSRTPGEWAAALSACPQLLTTAAMLLGRQRIASHPAEGRWPAACWHGILECPPRPAQPALTSLAKSTRSTLPATKPFPPMGLHRKHLQQHIDLQRCTAQRPCLHPWPTHRPGRPISRHLRLLAGHRFTCIESAHAFADGHCSYIIVQVRQSGGDSGAPALTAAVLPCRFAPAVQEAAKMGTSAPAWQPTTQSLRGASPIMSNVYSILTYLCAGGDRLPAVAGFRATVGATHDAQR